MDDEDLVECSKNIIIEMAKKKEVVEEPLEKKLWKAADKLRKNIDAAEYKHVVLGLIFLKYISDAFEELYATLKAEEENGADWVFRWNMATDNGENLTTDSAES